MRSFGFFFSNSVCVSILFQAGGGGGQVPGPAAAPSADLSGQTDDQQGDGAGEDEESRATDAAAEPCSGETPQDFCLGAA